MALSFSQLGSLSLLHLRSACRTALRLLKRQPAGPVWRCPADFGLDSGLLRVRQPLRKPGGARPRGGALPISVGQFIPAAHMNGSQDSAPIAKRQPVRAVWRCPAAFGLDSGLLRVTKENRAPSSLFAKISDNANRAAPDRGDGAVNFSVGQVISAALTNGSQDGTSIAKAPAQGPV